ncbi:MAG TPA: IS21-like element helper ATPase IstB [bacterium]|nr:IS21-like element helper ATPase IstB [bacterium]
MLVHPLMETLSRLKLVGMARALEEQLRTPEIESLSFTDRLALLLDRESVERDNRRLKSRLKVARLREAAAVEDIDYRHPRGLDKALLLHLTSCAFLREHLNVFITGPTGVGKTYLSCALGNKACREGYSVSYVRLPRLLENLGVGRGDGRYAKILDAFARTELLILDDWAMAPLTDEQRRDLFEILEDRYGRRSTIVVSQLPVEKWHDALGEPTLADAILDRLLHNGYKIALKGESMRKKKGRRLTENGHCEKQ